jgi:hypothetical protein
MLRNALGTPLPHGHGSVHIGKQLLAIMSRAREQAGFGLFQQTAREST